jgi:hypothetical protein
VGCCAVEDRAASALSRSLLHGFRYLGIGYCGIPGNHQTIKDGFIISGVAIFMRSHSRVEIGIFGFALDGKSHFASSLGTLSLELGETFRQILFFSDCYPSALLQNMYVITAIVGRYRIKPTSG